MSNIKNNTGSRNVVNIVLFFKFFERGFIVKKEHNDFQILKTIEADSSVSQRKLSSQMELNVASVNLAMNRLLQRGFITKEGVNQRRTKYYITPEGLRVKTQLAYKFVGRNIHYFNEVRNDIETRIVKSTKENESLYL